MLYMENDTMQNIESSSTPQPKPEKPRASSWPKIILITFLGLILISGLVFAYIQINKNQTTKQQNLTQIEVDQTNSPTELNQNLGPLSDWKNYSNDWYSFKYPQSYDTYAMEEISETAVMVAPKEIVDEAKQSKLGFNDAKFPPLLINVFSKMIIPQNDQYWQVTSEPITIGGVTGTIYYKVALQGMKGVSKGDKITSVVVNYKNAYIKIELLDQKLKEAYDQILSTFTFTN